jgi:hypothetical protein
VERIERVERVGERVSSRLGWVLFLRFLGVQEVERVVRVSSRTGRFLMIERFIMNFEDVERVVGGSSRAGKIVFIGERWF